MLPCIRRFRVWWRISPPAGWKILDLVHKKIHKVNFFVNKIKTVPCCRRRIGLQVWHQAKTSATA